MTTSTATTTRKTNPTIEWIRQRYPNLDQISLCLKHLSDTEAKFKNAEPQTDAEREEVQQILRCALFAMPQVNESLLSTIRQDFEALLIKCCGHDEESQICLDYLGYLLAADGAPLLDDLREWALLRCCETLHKMAEQGMSIAQVSSIVLGAMGRNTSLQPMLRLQLLSVYDALTVSPESPSRISCARTLHDALTVELSRSPGDVDENVISAILDRILDCPDPDVVPKLEALKRADNLPATAKHASYILDELYASPEKLWNETSADLISSLQERATMLERMNKPGLNDKEISEIIVYTFKDCLPDSYSDPRLPKLLEALDGKFPLVILTAALVFTLQNERKPLCEESPIFQSLAQKTATELSRIAMSTQDRRYSAHAIALMARLEKTSNSLAVVVNNAKTEASVHFIEAQSNQN